MNFGGLADGVRSVWKDSHTIHSAGATNSRPTTQATKPQNAAAAPAGLFAGCALGVLLGPGAGIDSGHHLPSSWNSDETVRRAKVAIRIEPITTITPAAEACP